jgi:hypothetical protein
VLRWQRRRMRGLVSRLTRSERGELLRGLSSFRQTTVEALSSAWARRVATVLPFSS